MNKSSKKQNQFISYWHKILQARYSIATLFILAGIIGIVGMAFYSYRSPAKLPVPVELSPTEELPSNTPQQENIKPYQPEIIVPEPPKTSHNIRVFFVRTNESGQLSLYSSIVAQQKVQKPLTDAIEALLQGPSMAERNRGAYSFMPEGSQLISAKVVDGVAYLNFNEAFRFNSMGTDGYTAQLQQIIYTATQFSTVSAVRIMIEGQMLDYLAEGINISAPLTRDSFNP